MKTLENEFREMVAQHKFAVVYAAAVKYYEDLQGTGAVLADTPENLTQQHMAKLMMMQDNGITFNRLYEEAWHEIADLLD